MSKIQSLLCEAEDYREFLEALVSFQKQRRPKYSYAQLSKDMGLASRNAAREIIRSQRRITARSLNTLLVHLKLPSDCAKLLLLLVYRSEPDLDPHKRNVAQLNGAWQKLREKMTARPLQTEGDPQKLYRHMHWPRVYAALGDSQGATLAAIQSRCQLPEKTISDILEALVACQMVRTADNSGKATSHSQTNTRYVATAAVVNMRHLGSSSLFKKHYQNGLRHLIGLSEEAFDDPNPLFHAACFSIRSEDLGRLSAELSELLSRFATESEDPQGDRVVRLSAGLSL